MVKYVKNPDLDKFPTKSDVGNFTEYDASDLQTYAANTGWAWDSGKGVLRLAEQVPATVVHQYRAEDFASPWGDEVGTADMTVNGLTSATFSDGSDAVEGDGSSDFGTAPIGAMGSQLTKSAWEFTVESTGFGGGWWGVGSASNLPLFNIRFDFNEHINSETGNFMLFIRDSNDNDIRVAPANNPNLDDGNKHTVSILLNDTTKNDVGIIIDGTSVSLAFVRQENPSFSNNFNSDFAFWARSNNGTIDNYLSAKHGIIRIHDEAITGQTI